MFTSSVVSLRVARAEERSGLVEVGFGLRLGQRRQSTPPGRDRRPPRNQNGNRGRYDAQSDAGFFGSQIGVLQVALALLDVDLGFDDVGMGGLATGLLFLCDVEKLLGFLKLSCAFTYLCWAARMA